VDRKIIADGYYEPEVWQRLQSVAKSGDVFWDIGGHIGSVAIRAGEHPKIYAVHTFEPNPETFHALTLNLKLNPGLPITKHNVALSSSRDTGVLHTGAAGNSGRASMQRTEGRPRTVSCETIDHLVANEIVPPPDLMKLDVEGWESEVLRGAQWTLRTFPPRAIVFEDEPAGENDISDTFTLLNSVGYTIEAIERSSEEPVEVENYLALRSECTDLRCFED
jgi:FkbM family methyltransferase